MHSLASSEHLTKAAFIGAYAYSTSRSDDKQLRASYAKPVKARTSLMPEEDEAKSFPVGFGVDENGDAEWYVINEYGHALHIRGFYIAGEGASARMMFLHPELNKPVEAKFQGLERPKPISPNPKPENLLAGMSNLNLTESQATKDLELVRLTVKFGKKMQKPLRCDTKDQPQVKTNWDDWEFFEDVSSFQCQLQKKTLRCPSLPVGVEAVTLAFNSNLERPFYFYTERGILVYTVYDYWHHGKNNSFYVYLHDGVFYLAYYWPNQDEASRGFAVDEE
jgi:hypothetical protein